jgi:hypothetical protein
MRHDGGKGPRLMPCGRKQWIVGPLVKPIDLSKILDLRF